MNRARSLLLLLPLAACAGSSPPAAAPAAVPWPIPAAVPACGSDAGSATEGVLRGIVSDRQTGAALAGVTVVANSPTMATAQTAITDEAGAYKLVLPPGTFLATFYYLDVTLERKDIAVGAGCETSVFPRIDQSMNRNEVIRVN